MKIVLRVDASLQMGTGHLMRCATLARELSDRGARCHFVCRDHEGNLAGFLRQAGFTVSILSHTGLVDAQGPAHRDWLGDGWQSDAAQTAAIVRDMAANWIIVDHYALNDRWEAVVAAERSRVMVIDDLADRPHAADILLDQTFGGGEERYRGLVTEQCKLLCGSMFALLRPEFAQMADASRTRRSAGSIERVLVTLGGIDKDNVTALVLDAIDASTLPAKTVIDIVMGVHAPWLDAVRLRAAGARCDMRVHVNVTDMAGLMVESDLAIGAAGSTAWERCCLGLPALMAVIADNQAEIARSLHEAGAAWSMGSASVAAFGPNLVRAIDQLVDNPAARLLMSRAAAGVTDGCGAQRAADTLWQLVQA